MFLVIVIPFGNLDMIGMLHSASRQDLIRMAIHVLEKNMELAKKTGANQVVVVFDMDGFNLRQYAWRPGTEMDLNVYKYKQKNVFFSERGCHWPNTDVRSQLS